MNEVPVMIVADENGILYAKLPDGKLQKITAEVYGSPVWSYYGFLRIANLTEVSDEMP